MSFNQRPTCIPLFNSIVINILQYIDILICLNKNINENKNKNGERRWIITLGTKAVKSPTLLDRLLWDVIGVSDGESSPKGCL